MAVAVQGSSGLVPPDGLVVDYFAGRASLARACWSEGREYVGAELDPERFEKGCGALAYYMNTNTRAA